jgi:hypothetical protein
MSQVQLKIYMQELRKTTKKLSHVKRSEDNGSNQRPPKYAEALAASLGVRYQCLCPLYHPS